MFAASQIRKSHYYYWEKHFLTPIDKDFELKETIQKIFEESNKTYGYRRITMELHNRSINVNHKKVLKLMKLLNLVVYRRKHKKYSSYKGQIGPIADNLIQRNFISKKPLEKLFTDITEFKLFDDLKVYLSLVVDGFNGEIFYQPPFHWVPNLQLIKDTFEPLIKSRNLSGCIIHSDQGWHYQHKYFVNLLKANNIIQSMSRKGNSPDNGLVEILIWNNKIGILLPKQKQFHKS
ncbi:IS3 family transposase [Mycoplasma seminis]|uniref:IS3 family transposase n=1 Tax=Mycoplasma seminis TaxID=512749 RepID=A0ABY9HCP8_9MOLU|nr:IS3 family transposase [Mycoplasma seminis]WLP85965.1 IS3 family transposase [Mycoplasma seminis]